MNDEKLAAQMAPVLIARLLLLEFLALAFSASLVFEPTGPLPEFTIATLSSAIFQGTHHESAH
ncbi:hypothetical protein [Pseudomonas putida]|uniref:Uncharacterized protein n=1 Tax=Pseudomonas putida TaxID=303 RepID=A0ABD7B6U4_PSEPU|nr:hypothetical protein [Pseudomonas putida]QOC95439.1 hypothetical protein ID616_14950 [Pseudomonas putida]